MTKRTGWHTASPNGETCVEVHEYFDAGHAGIRDTKETGQANRTTLRLPHAVYAEFIEAARAGRFTA